MASELNVGTVNATEGVQISTSGNANLTFAGTVANINQYANNDLVFKTNNTERARINSAGNVGVGTSSPTSPYTKAVHVHNPDGLGSSVHITDATSGSAAANGLDLTVYGTTAYVYNRTAGALVFGTAAVTAAPIERMRIDSAGVANFGGDVKVLTGDIQMGSGRGINFSATADAPGMTSETLDDYEEGTWTPVHADTYSGGGGDPVKAAGTSPVFSGTYTRIGNIVHATAILDFDDSTAIAVDDRWTMSGLPFTPVALDYTATNSFFVYSSLGSGINAVGVVGASAGGKCLFYVTNIAGAITYETKLTCEFTYAV